MFLSFCLGVASYKNPCYTREDAKLSANFNCEDLYYEGLYYGDLLFAANFLL